MSKRDRGARKLLEAVRNGTAGLKVGWVGAKGAELHEDSDGLTVAEVGEIHEYGLGTAPERAPIRHTIDAQAPQIVAMIHEGARAVMKGRATPHQVLDQIGLYAVGAIQAAIRDGLPPALSEAYLRRKLAKYPGASTPLIASGQLVQGLTHKIDPGAKERGQ